MSADKTAEADAKGIPLKSAYPEKPSVPGELLHATVVSIETNDVMVLACLGDTL